MNLKNILLAGAFGVLAVVAAVGWSRSPAPSQPATNNAQNYAQPADYSANQATQAADQNQPANQASQQDGCAPNTDNSQAGSYSQAATYQPPNDGYMNSIHRPVVVRQAAVTEPVPTAETAYANGAPEPNYPAQQRYEVRHRHHRRSIKKSVAIVAGSAGVGAAIGALAGGGRGAGIGALAGGAGGFIYDRLTHNH